MLKIILNKIKRLFCTVGIHWLMNHRPSFYDNIGRQQVYRADCICGKKWLDSSTFPVTVFSKVKRV